MLVLGQSTGDLAFDTVIMDYDTTSDIEAMTVNINNGGTTTTGDVTIVTGSEFDGARRSYY